MEEQTKKEVRSFIYDIDGVRGYRVVFEHNGYEQEINVNLNEYVGYRVKIIQRLKKISTNQLAKRGGFANSTMISRIKSGKHSFQIDTIYRLCMGLDCKSSDLLPF
jgi:DNA-binding Xre family transcriptional regulator